MLNFIFFFFVFLGVAAFLFERVEFKSFWPLSLTLVTIFLLSLITAGLPWEGVLLFALLFALIFATFLHPNLRRNIVLFPLIRRLDNFAETEALWEEDWFDKQPIVTSAEETKERPSFLGYLARGRLSGEFYDAQKQSSEQRFSETLYARLFELWDKKDAEEELQEFLRQEGLINLEASSSPYEFSRLLARLAYKEAGLAKMVFNLNNGLVSLLTARGTLQQKKRYLSSRASSERAYHLVSPHLLVGFSASIEPNPSTEGGVKGITVHPTHCLEGVPDMADVCGLCLRVMDSHHQLGETDAADVCALVSTKTLRQRGLIAEGASSKKCASFSVPLKDVLPLSQQDIRYRVFGKLRQFTAALALTQTLRLLRIGGSLVAAKAHLQPQQPRPLRTLAELSMLAKKSEALTQFTNRYGGGDAPPFEGDEEEILLLERLQRKLASFLPELLRSRFLLSPHRASMQPQDVLLPGLEELPEENLNLARILKRATQGDKHYEVADRAVCQMLSRWGQNLIRSFGLGLSFGWISAHRTDAAKRSLSHLTCLFATLMDTDFFLHIWRGDTATDYGYLRAYHSLAADYALLPATDEMLGNSALRWELSRSYACMGNWLNSLALNRFTSCLLRWFLMPWGSVSRASEEDSSIATEIIIPTARREEALSWVSIKGDKDAVLAEEVCKLAWAVRDIYDAHHKERVYEAGSELDWYDQLLQKKSITAEEAKLLRRFYAAFNKLLQSL